MIRQESRSEIGEMGGGVVEQILGVLWVTTGTLMFSWEEMGAMGGF